MKTVYAMQSIISFNWSKCSIIKVGLNSIISFNNEITPKRFFPSGLTNRNSNSLQIWPKKKRVRVRNTLSRCSCLVFCFHKGDIHCIYQGNNYRILPQLLLALCWSRKYERLCINHKRIFCDFTWVHSLLNL